MKIFKIFAILLLCFNACLFCHGQAFSKTEADSIHFRIYNFLQKDNSVADTTASEYLFIVISLGNENKVKSINLLSDSKNEGFVYSLLCKITPDLFVGWMARNYPNSTIIIPFYSNGVNAKKSYADMVLWDPTFAGLNSKIIWQNKSSTMTSGIFYQVRNKPEF